MNGVRNLPGLPPYGPSALAFPAAFARRGAEGFVVEFTTPGGTSWVGNFEPGHGNVSGTRAHPNGVDVVVIASGTAYVASRDGQTAAELAQCVEQVWHVEGSPDLVCQLLGIEFVRIGVAGIAWRTRRVSWDGFADLEQTRDTIRGHAWEPGGTWVPFVLDLRTGEVQGGSFTPPNREASGFLRRAWAWLTSA